MQVVSHNNNAKQLDVARLDNQEQNSLSEKKLRCDI